MATKTPAPVIDINASIYEEFLEVPENIKHYFQDGAEPRFSFRFTQKTKQQIEDMGDYLMKVRGIVKVSSMIGPEHFMVSAIAALAAANGDDRPTESFVEDVRRMHDEWRMKAQSDANVIVLTEMTRLRNDIEPTPYPDETEESVENDWDEPVLKFPSPKINLQDRRERRFKVIADILGETDIFFIDTFMKKILYLLPNIFRKAGAEAAASADFQSKRRGSRKSG